MPKTNQLKWHLFLSFGQNLKRMSKNTTHYFFISQPNTDLQIISKGFGNLIRKKDDSDLFYIVTDNQNNINALKEIKSIDTLEKGKQLKIISTSSIYSEISDSNADNIVFTFDQNIENFSTLKSNFPDKISSNQLIRFVPNKEKKKPYSPLKNRLHKLYTSLSWGFEGIDDYHAFLAFEKQSLLNVLKTKFTQKKSGIEFFQNLQKASFCKNFKVENCSCNFASFYPIKKSIFQLKASNFINGNKSRVSYMVGEAISEFKQTSWAGLSNPNHGAYRFSLFLMMLFSVIVLPILSFGYGMTWDEPDNAKYAEDILKYFFSFGENQNVFDITNPKNRVYSHLINYGLFFDSFAALVAKVSPFSLYETRHLLNALVAVIGMSFTAMAAREMANWRTALIAFFIILFTPFYFGHGMNNPKDIPFAAGFVMSLYFILRFLKQLPKPQISTIIYVILSIAFVNSIRIGGLMLLGILGLFTGLIWLMQSKSNGLKFSLPLIPKYAKYVIGIGLVSYILGILPWPYGLQNPIENPFIALKSFTQFSNVTIYEIFEGERLYMNLVPWYYIPKFLLIGNPLYAVGGLALGALALFIPKIKIDKGALWFFAFALVFPIAYAAYGESTLYNGWRHFIFVYPAMVILAAAGWEMLFQKSKNKILSGLVGLILLSLILKTGFWMVKYHPHQYTYYNELIGGYSGAYAKYEGDSYGNGIRSAFEKLNELAPEIQQQKTLVAFNMTGWDWEHPETEHYFGKNIIPSWVRDYERYKKPWDYAIFFPRTFAVEELKNGAYPPKGTIYTEEVEGKPLYAIVKRENDFMSQGFELLGKNQFAEAAANFKSYTEYDNLNEEAWRQLGLCYLNLGEWENARIALENAININPESHIGYSYLGVYFARQNNAVKAMELFEKAISLKVNHSFAYQQLGNIQFQTQQYAKAIENLESAMNYVGRPDPQSLNLIGACYSNLRNFDLAIKYFSQAIQMNPNFADAYQNLGLAMQQKGDNQKAQKYFQKAQQLSGN